MNLSILDAKGLRDHIVKRLVAAYDDKDRKCPYRCKESNKWADTLLIASSKERIIAEWVNILKEHAEIGNNVAYATSMARYAILVPFHLEEELRPSIEACLPGLRHYYETIEGPKEYPNLYKNGECRISVSWYTVDSRNCYRLVGAGTTTKEIRRALEEILLGKEIDDDASLDSLPPYQRGCLESWAYTVAQFWEQNERKLDEIRGVDVVPEFFKTRLPDGFLEKIAASDAKRLVHGKKEINETEYLIEANSNESHYIWRDWALQAKYSNERVNSHYNHERFPWEQLGMGYCKQIGKLDKRPVMITIFWNRINGHLIGFWTMDSQVCDYKMAEKWLDKTFPGVPRTDATNCGHALRVIQDKATVKAQ
jgi:hypothetical protein